MSALLEQWDAERNAPLTPRDVFCASRRMAWWQCDRGHSWRARIASRAQNGRGCPYCKGKLAIPGETDLATCFPEVAEQWDAARNGELTPQSLLPSSNRAVWWLCEKNHSYRAVVAHRTRMGTGCPYCAGRRVLPGFNDLATLFPRVAEQWHPTLNGTLTPEMVTAGSHRQIWWQCGEGHVWKAKIYSRTDARQCGCPVCTGRFRESYVTKSVETDKQYHLSGGNTNDKEAICDSVVTVPAGRTAAHSGTGGRRANSDCPGLQ